MRLLFLILVSLIAVAQDVGDSSSGFERQYGPAVDALRAGDRAGAKRALDSFALPAEWFQQTFGASGETLKQQYQSEFAYFEYAETRKIQEQLNGAAARFETEVHLQPTPPSPPPKTSPPTLHPLPSMESVEIKVYDDQSGSPIPKASWANRFAFVNGAFRFFGVGGYPFWDPVRIRRADMCDPNGRQPGGQLINAATPSYPDEAKNQGVQGTVSLRINVAKDGSVSSVDVVNGDPLLTESATAAAKQWRYQPFMNCGEPMEAQSLERVKYSLSASGSMVEVVKRSNTLRISSGVAASNLNYRVNPTYPAEAKQAGIQGMVVLILKIGTDGQPHDIQLASGAPELAPAAMDAVRQWRYTPYTLNGQPVEVETSVQINFTLHR